jgi:histidine triad (HIT) family protein
MTDEHDPSCLFCRIVRGDLPCSKVLETDAAFAFLDLNPVNPYHTLVVPKRHRRDLFDATAEDLAAVTAAAKAVLELYRTRIGVEQCQLVCSSGPAAQQDVFHLHVHVIPRHAGDGADLAFRTRPELREEFDALLARLGGPDD